MNNKLTEKPSKDNDKKTGGGGEPGFVIIPKMIVDLIAAKKLKESDIKTYIALGSFRNNKTNTAFPKVESIAERAGMSDKAVKPALKRLIEFGLIVKGKKPKGQNKFNGNIYTFPQFSKSDSPKNLNTPPTPPVAAKTEETDAEYLTRKQQEFPEHNVKEIYADFLSKCGNEKYPKMKPTRRKFDDWLQSQDRLISDGDDIPFV
jgi:predicted transcriptional regulator